MSGSTTTDEDSIESTDDRAGDVVLSYSERTVRSDVEPEYVGAFSAVDREECTVWIDAEAEGEDGDDAEAKRRCGAEATHTIVEYDGSDLCMIAACDDHGEPDDVEATDRRWSGELRQ